LEIDGFFLIIWFYQRKYRLIADKAVEIAKNTIEIIKEKHIRLQMTQTKIFLGCQQKKQTE